MRTPAFWRSRNLLSTALLPLAFLYNVVRKWRRFIVKPVTLPVCVLCIGNLTAGGAGKTPVALAIGRWCKNKGINAFYLSRGYGGALHGPVLVDASRHSAAEVGDEPLLLATTLPTIVAKDRVQGGRAAVQRGAQLILMDDGLQNPSLHKDISLLVIDGDYGFGNSRLLPAGPLREPVAEGIGRAQAVVVINAGEKIMPLPKTKPVVHARTVPVENAERWQGKKVVAFCGIARPQKFFATVTGLGATLVEARGFADHHPYTTAELECLIDLANVQQAALVTTAKDFMRIPASYQLHVQVIEIAIVFDQPEALYRLIEEALRGKEA